MRRLSIVDRRLSIGWHGQAQRRHACLAKPFAPALTDSACSRIDISRTPEGSRTVATGAASPLQADERNPWKDRSIHRLAPGGGEGFPSPAQAIALLVLLTLALCIAGCTEKEKTDATPTAPPVTRTAMDGPVTVTLTASPGQVAFPQHAEVIVEVTADKDAIVQVADYDRAPEHLEHQYEYRLSRRTRQSALPAPDGKLKWTQGYDLEFFLPGDYALPGATVTFTEPATTSTVEGTTQAPAERRITTESIAMAVKDPSAKVLTAEELRKIELPAPVELPGFWSRWWWLLPAFAALLVCTIWLMRRRTVAEAVAPPIPAHEWARRQIAALVIDDLIRRGLIQEFYYRISGIVRGYIERRFAVAAAEMTTEEFLTAAARDGRFGPAHTASLQEFLTACDLVKYARQIPGSGEADRALQAAGAFVETTRADRAPDSANRPSTEATAA